MPTATFQPVIGSGFDQVAAQQFGWAQHNARQDASNIARGNEAQQNWNRYLASLADLERSDVQQQERMQWADRAQSENLAAARRQEASRRREFDIKVQLDKAQLKAQAAQWDFARKENDLLEQQDAQQIINAGEMLAPEFNAVAKARDKAAEAWDAAQRDINTIGNGLLRTDLAGVADVTYDPRSMTFRHVRQNLGMTIANLPEDVQQKVFKAQAAVDAAKAERESAKIALDQAALLFEPAAKMVGQYGFAPVRDASGDWVLKHPHPRVNRTFKGMVQEARAALPPPPPPTPWQPPEGSLGASLLAPPPQAQFTPNIEAATATGTMAPPPAPGGQAGVPFWVSPQGPGGPAFGQPTQPFAPTPTKPSKVWVRGPNGKLVLAQ